MKRLTQIIAGAMLGAALYAGGCECRDQDDGSPCCAMTGCGDGSHCEIASYEENNTHCVQDSNRQVHCCKCVPHYCSSLDDEEDTDHESEQNMKVETWD